MLKIEKYLSRTTTALSAFLSSVFLLALPLAQAQVPSSAAPPPPSKFAPSTNQATTVSPQPPAQPTAEQLADALVVRQRYQAAIHAYMKAPPTAAVWNKMGIAYQMMFNLKEAQRCYKESLKLDSRNPNVLNNLGTVYDSLKDYRQAERYYRKALKYEPNSAVVLKNLGTNLLTQHKYSRGWEEYKRALASDPEIFEDRNGPQVQNPTSIEQRGAMNYYMAMGCARARQTECALQYLRMAINEGFITPKKAASDVAFESLRDNPDFKQLLASENNPKAQQSR